MPRRSSSLNTTDSGISRELGTQYAVVKQVAERLDDILVIGEFLNNNLDDFMFRSQYDLNNSGVVDNSERLAGYTVAQLGPVLTNISSSSITWSGTSAQMLLGDGSLVPVHTTGSLAELQTGTDTSGKLQTAKNLKDFVLSFNYLTAELDPTVPSYVKGITLTDINDWTTAVSWGNHALSGYAVSGTGDTQVRTNLALDSRFSRVLRRNCNVSEDLKNFTSTDILLCSDNTIWNSLVNTPPITNTEAVIYREVRETDATPQRQITVITHSGDTWFASTDPTNVTVWLPWRSLSITEAERVKLTGLSNYTLPAATKTALGGVRLFSNTVQTEPASTVTSTANRTYGIQFNSAGEAVVNVPWEGSVYTTMTLPEMQAGVSTTGQLVRSDILTAWLNSKDFVLGSAVGSAAYEDTSFFLEATDLGVTVASLSGPGGTVPRTQLPMDLFKETYFVNSEAEMLALDASVGDTAIRLDEGFSYSLRVLPASVLANWVLTNNSGITSTDELVEGTTNLYFTTSRARSAISSTATGITYTSSTGQLSLTSGYVIPTSSEIADWDLAFTWGDHSVAGYAVSGTGAGQVRTNAELDARYSQTDTTYTVTSLTDLNAGVSTVGELQTASKLNQWIAGKSYVTVTQLTDELINKVDKVVGKQLSDENFTLAEKTKLSGLAGTKWRGEFVSLSALQTAIPTASAGDYADVNAGGVPVIRYIWNADTSTWQSTTLTGSQIKTLYEGEPDTNGFTDAEKTKLSNALVESDLPSIAYIKRIRTLSLLSAI